MSTKVRRNNNAPRNNRGRPVRSNNGRRNNNSKPQNLSQNLHKAKQAKEKYLSLAQESMSSGDRVQAESYYQHVDHYVRIINSLTKEKDLAEAKQAEDAEKRKEKEVAEANANATNEKDIDEQEKPSLKKEENLTQKPAESGEEKTSEFLPGFLTAEA